MTRLVYADWLQERDEVAKSEFLRMTVELSSVKKANKGKLQLRLQQLAATLDTDWLAIVSSIPVEKCGQVKQTAAYELRLRIIRSGLAPSLEEPPPPLFEFECPQSWEQFTPTDDPAVRFCDGCKENVYYCDTIKTARDHARRGHCVAVDLGIIRKDSDLDPPRMKMGRMLPEAAERRMAQIEARLKLDPVSETREKAKKERGDA